MARDVVARRVWMSKDAAAGLYRGAAANVVAVDESATIDPSAYELLRGIAARGNVVMFATASMCRCGAYIVDGPFRFCVRCRQVDVKLKAGGLA